MGEGGVRRYMGALSTFHQYFYNPKTPKTIKSISLKKRYVWYFINIQDTVAVLWLHTPWCYNV